MSTQPIAKENLRMNAIKSTVLLLVAILLDGLNDDRAAQLSIEIRAQ